MSKATTKTQPKQGARNVYVSQETAIALQRLGFNSLSKLIKCVVALADESVTVRELLQADMEAK